MFVITYVEALKNSGVSLSIQNENRSILFVLMLVFASFYFNVLPYIIKFLDINIVSSYYTLNIITEDTFIVSSLISIAFFIVSSVLLIYYHFSGALVRNLNYSPKIPFLFELIFAVAVILITKDHFSQSRDVIKSGSTLVSEIIIISSISICSYKLLIDKRIIPSLLRFLFIVYIAIVIFEREFFLFAVIPLILRVRVTGKSLIVLSISSVVFMSTILLYKDLVNYSRGKSPDNSTNGILYKLGVDTIHKLSLEVSYIDGENVPNYKPFSLVSPYQIPRFVEPEHTTNSRLATDYYTGGNTGTGFSSWLEGYINFGMAGIVLVPLIVLLIIHLTTGVLGQSILIPLLIFSIKYNRAELWPLLISTVIFPSLLIYIISKLSMKRE